MKRKGLHIDIATVTVLLLTVAIAAITLVAALVFSKKNNNNGIQTESETNEISFPEISGQPDRPDITVTFETNSKNDKYEKDGIELIYSNISFPVLDGGDKDATAKINSDILAYVTEAVRIKSYEKTLSEDDYQLAIRDEMEFIPFDFNTICDSIYIKNGFISILFRRIDTVGMMEPEETVYSLCYDLATGEKADFSALIGTDDVYAVNYIKSVISQHIEIYPWLYYADAYEVLQDIIDLNSFYLTKSGVTLYFNPEIITPSVYGVCTFTVPYDKLGM